MDPSVADRLAALDRRLSAIEERLGIESSVDDETRALIASGDIIEAINVYRARTGVGLREAKEAVDELERQQLGT